MGAQVLFSTDNDSGTLEKNSRGDLPRDVEKIQDAGFSVAEIPVHHRHRPFVRSQLFNVCRLGRTALTWRALGTAWSLRPDPVGDMVGL